MNRKQVLQSPLLAIMVQAMAMPMAYAGRVKTATNRFMERLDAAMPGLKTNTEAAFNLGRSLTIVGVFVGAILVLLVVAALLPQLFPAIGSVVANITSGSTGNETADALLPVFGLIIALSIVIGVVVLIMNSTSFGKR